MTAEKLAELEARIAATDMPREKDRAAIAASVGIAVVVAGLPAIGATVLVVGIGWAGVRLVRREVAGARLILFDQRRDVDLRVVARH